MLLPLEYDRDAYLPAQLFGTLYFRWSLHNDAICASAMRERRWPSGERLARAIFGDITRASISLPRAAVYQRA